MIAFNEHIIDNIDTSRDSLGRSLVSLSELNFKILPKRLAIYLFVVGGLLRKPLRMSFSN